MLRDQVENALQEKARLLMATGRPAEAVVVADALIEHAEDQADPKQVVHLAEALVAKGTALVSEGRCEEAVEVLDEMIKHFEDAFEPALRKQVTLALNSMVTALAQLGRDEESDETFHKLAVQFGDEALVLFDETAVHLAKASEPHEREQLASVLIARAGILGDMGRQSEALPLLAELIARFEDDENAAVQDIVSEAREARDEMVNDEGD